MASLSLIFPFQISDLKRLIPQVKSQVLVGHKLVFSGLVPNSMKLHQSKAFQVARSLGATVTQSFEPDTTHLVAVNGTSKVHHARKNPKIKIVTPEWLWTCAERWEHVEELLFPLRQSKPVKMNRQPPPHCHSPGRFRGFLKFLARILNLMFFFNRTRGQLRRGQERVQ